METGLVIGNFLPPHLGHIKLFEFASQYCDKLIVLICSSDKETISGDQRLIWLKEILFQRKKIEVQLFNYKEKDLPNTSIPSQEVSKIWADHLKAMFPLVTIIFSSEKYGEYVASFMKIKYQNFDISRQFTPISSTEIRTNPFKSWAYIPENVRPFFTKKVCLVGTESTGKTTLTKKLSQHFEVCSVTETARDIVEETEKCTYDQLQQIAKSHALEIIQALKTGNKIIIIDTDVTITMSYSKFLFGKALQIPDWIKDANNFDLYLYLDKEAPYVQDGTRLSLNQRNKLDEFHRKEFAERNIKFQEINGNWNERLQKCISIIQEEFKLASE